MSNVITIQESARLVQLEKVVERGLSNFIEVGEALMEIRDSRLYRIEHKTFEDYCRQKWGMTQQYATQLGRSSQAAKALTNETTVSLPTSERQARPLTQLDTPAQQREAWQDAVESSGGKPTAKHVEAAVAEVKSRIRPISETEFTPAQQARFAEAEKDSEQLWLTKSHFKKLNKKDRVAFDEWRSTQK